MGARMSLRAVYISAAAFLIGSAFVHKPVQASQEQVVPFDSVSFESAGAGRSGSVSVTGTQNASGIQSLSVKAFGREFKATKAEIAALKAVSHFNGIQVSYEPGYSYLGGRTLYLVMWSGSLRRSWNAKLLIVQESGGVSVRDFPGPGTGTVGAAFPAKTETGQQPQSPSQVDVKTERPQPPPRGDVTPKRDQ